MEKRDLIKELDNIRDIVTKKLAKSGSFPQFIVSYTGEGNHFVQIEQWETPDDRDRVFAEAIEFVKSEMPYMFIFGSFTTKRKFKTPEDFENQVNGTDIKAILLVGKTPDKTYHMSIEYPEYPDIKTPKITVRDVTDKTDDGILEEIFRRVN